MQTPAGTILVETPTTIDLEVALVHLVSGEDIIARVEFDVANRIYHLTKPFAPLMKPKVDPQTGEQTGVGMVLVPYRPFLDENEPLLIRDANVLFTGKLQEGLAKHYQAMTSPIIVADPSSVGGNFANIRVQ